MPELTSTNTYMVLDCFLHYKSSIKMATQQKFLKKNGKTSKIRTFVFFTRIFCWVSLSCHLDAPFISQESIQDHINVGASQSRHTLTYIHTFLENPPIITKRPLLWNLAYFELILKIHGRAGGYGRGHDEKNIIFFFSS